MAWKNAHDQVSEEETHSKHKQYIQESAPHFANMIISED